MIKKVTHALRVPVIFLLITVLIASGVVANNAVPAQMYTGEDIFKGLAFGVGPLGEKLPIEQQYKDDLNNSPESLAVIDMIVMEMKRINPGYFQMLQQASYARDIVRVDMIVHQGEPLLVQALDNMGLQYQGHEFSDMAVAVAGWIAMIGALVYNYAGAVHTVAAAVNLGAYLNIAVYQYVYFWGPKSQSTRLDREMYIVQVLDVIHLNPSPEPIPVEPIPVVPGH